MLFSKATAPPRGKRKDVRQTGHNACLFVQRWKYEVTHWRQNVCWQHGSSFGCTSLFQQIAHCSSLFIFSITPEFTALFQKHNSLLSRCTQIHTFICQQYNNRTLTAQTRHAVMVQHIELENVASNWNNDDIIDRSYDFGYCFMANDCIYCCWYCYQEISIHLWTITNISYFTSISKILRFLQRVNLPNESSLIVFRYFESTRTIYRTTIAYIILHIAAHCKTRLNEIILQVKMSS